MHTTDTPRPGQILRLEDEGRLEHVRAMSHPWIIVEHHTDVAEPMRIALRARRKVTARLQLQELRGNLEPGHVLHILEWVIGGWKLHETAPRLHPGSMDGSKEVIWGHTARPIALVELEKHGGWWLWMPDEDTPGMYRIPDRSSRDGLHFTRDEAIAAARRLSSDQPSEDSDWPDRWQRALRVTRAAGHAELRVPIEFLGPTGLTCGYPECGVEAETRVSVFGSDVAGEQARLCCYNHAAMVTAPLLRP
ncbi:MAG: hypothetical protein GX542_13165, partial [Rhodococcus sp.]|nr:hypothetical protein [Rhodococcus sp. (in: high G+C Gram-positive bacteria)]